jgi:hypothetical protein
MGLKRPEHESSYLLEPQGAEVNNLTHQNCFTISLNVLKLRRYDIYSWRRNLWDHLWGFSESLPTAVASEIHGIELSLYNLVAFFFWEFYNI